MQKWVLPSFFVTKTTGEAQGLVDACMTPLSSMLLISSIWCLPRGRLLGGLRTGRAVPVFIRCFTRLVCPRSFLETAKMSWYFFRRSAKWNLSSSDRCSALASSSFCSCSPNAELDFCRLQILTGLVSRASSMYFDWHVPTLVFELWCLVFDDVLVPKICQSYVRTTFMCCDDSWDKIELFLDQVFTRLHICIFSEVSTIDHVDGHHFLTPRWYSGLISHHHSAGHCAASCYPAWEKDFTQSHGEITKVQPLIVFKQNVLTKYGFHWNINDWDV